MTKAGKKKLSGTLDTVRSQLSQSSTTPSWKREIIEGRRKEGCSDAQAGHANAAKPASNETGTSLPAEQTDFPADDTGVAVQTAQNHVEEDTSERLDGGR